MKNWKTSLLIFSLLFAAGLILPRWLKPAQLPKKPNTSALALEDQQKEMVNMQKPKEENTPILTEFDQEPEVEEVKDKTIEKSGNPPFKKEDQPEEEKEQKPTGFHRVLLTNTQQKAFSNPMNDERLSFQAMVFGTQEVDDGAQLSMLAEENIEVGEEQVKRNQALYPKVQISGDTLLLSLKINGVQFFGYTANDKRIIIPTKNEGKIKTLLKNKKVQSPKPTMKITDKFLVTFKTESEND